MSEIIEYITENTCSKKIIVEIEDNKIKNIQFIGGCSGNLAGIRNLVLGEDIFVIREKLKGIPCGTKQTSCPDQLARCLEEYIKQKAEKNIKNALPT